MPKQLVGDFLHLGYEQVLFINDPNTQTGAGNLAAGNLVIGDFSDIVWGRREYVRDDPLMQGWNYPNVTALAGDFMGLGYAQAIFFNPNPGGGRVMVADFSTAPPMRIPYFEQWGQTGTLNGWESSAYAAGDFMGLGHDQVLLINQTMNPVTGYGRVQIVDVSSGKPPMRVLYWARWDQEALDGWTLTSVGDFMNLGHDQVLLTRPTPDPTIGYGHVKIVDFKLGKPPMQTVHAIPWSQGFDGWTFTSAGDFMGFQSDQVFLTKPPNVTGRAMIIDVSGRLGTPFGVAYDEDWGQSNVLDGWDNAVLLPGKFMKLSHTLALFSTAAPHLDVSGGGMPDHPFVRDLLDLDDPRRRGSLTLMTDFSGGKPPALTHPMDWPCAPIGAWRV